MGRRRRRGAKQSGGEEREESPRERVSEHGGGTGGGGPVRSAVSVQRETDPDQSHEEAEEIRQRAVPERHR